MPSKQNIEKIANWKKENVDVIRMPVRKEYQLPERLDYAVQQGIAASRQAYIIAAVNEKLDRDGIKRIGGAE